MGLFKSLPPVSCEHIIDSPRERIYQVLSCVGQWHLWNPFILKAEALGPVKKGTTGVAYSPQYGKAQMIVTEAIPNSRFSVFFKTLFGLVQIEYCLYEISAGRTRVKRITRLGGFFGWLTYQIKGKAYNEGVWETLLALERETVIN